MGPATAGQSLSLQSALYGALMSNPDLVTLRQGNPIAPTPEAVEVARRLPTTLNPTLWVDFRPITLIPRDPFPSGGTANPAPAPVPTITSATPTCTSRSDSR